VLPGVIDSVLLLCGAAISELRAHNDAIREENKALSEWKAAFLGHEAGTPFSFRSLNTSYSSQEIQDNCQKTKLFCCRQSLLRVAFWMKN